MTYQAGDRVWLDGDRVWLDGDRTRVWWVVTDGSSWVGDGSWVWVTIRPESGFLPRTSVAGRRLTLVQNGLDVMLDLI